MPKYRKKPVIVDASQWFKNGDHPQDDCHMVKPDDNSTSRFEPFLSEGNIVRRFNLPDIPGQGTLCAKCDKIMADHGWTDTLEGGHIVCPGDWIITGIKGEMYPCKPDIFEATYEKVEEPEYAAQAAGDDGVCPHCGREEVYTE